ncbi:MAG: CIA30 family protein [Deinococcota bacterium]
MKTRLITVLIITASLVGSASATTLFEFDSADSVTNWVSVDDRVMGGVSVSQMSYAGDGLALFSGNMSLANNGGFASVRLTDNVYNLSEFEGVELRVKGGNLTYQFRFQTDIARISYTQPFVAPDEWTTVRLPFDAFEATFFGRRVVDAPQMNTAFLRTLTFMLADSQAGEFELLIDWIKVY